MAAWALNCAARHHPDAVERLRTAGAELRAAQEEALAGDAGRLRDAGRALADEVERVAALAAGALRATGRPASAAQQDKIASTLRTAAVDDHAGEVLTRGVLVEEFESTGFDLLGAGSGDLSAAPGEAPSGTGRTSRRPAGGRRPPHDDRDLAGGGAAALPGAQRTAKTAKPSKEAVEAVEAARREVRRCDAEADMAATRARRRAERAEGAAKRAAGAQREAEEARSEAEEAAAAAESARRRAAEAAAALADAEAALNP